MAYAQRKELSGNRTLAIIFVAIFSDLHQGDWIAIGLACWAGSILVGEMGWDRSIGTRRTT